MKSQERLIIGRFLVDGKIGKSCDGDPEIENISVPTCQFGDDYISLSEFKDSHGNTICDKLLDLHYDSLLAEVEREEKHFEAEVMRDHAADIKNLFELKN